MIHPKPADLEIVAPLFRVRRGLRVQFQALADEPRVAQISSSAMARNLALGHRLVRAVENEEIGSFAELARMMGVSRAWVSMLVELTFLAPDLQQLMLKTRTDPSLGMTLLLKIGRLPEWQFQRQRLQRLLPTALNCLDEVLARDRGFVVRTQPQ